MKSLTLIGKGMTAEVYKWDHDKVLKLFYKKYGNERAQYEANIGRAVHQAGVPSPAVYEVIDVDDRKGIVFQRIFGKSLLKHLMAKPWKLFYYARQLARLQYKIHQYSTDELPSQKERLSIAIEKSSQRLGDRKKRIMEYMDSLPCGTCICHGDIHFNNVIVSGNKLVAVDWNSAYTGNPLGDVARTCLMLKSPVVFPGTPYIIVKLTHYTKRLACRIYLSEYMKLAKVKYKNIDEWILPIAAAKLREKAPREEKWLMDMINKRLCQLERQV